MAGGGPLRRVRRAARPGRSGPRARGPRRAARVGPPPREARLDLHRLAHGVRRPRAAALPAGDLPRGVRPRQRARPRQPPRRGAARPDPDRVRHRRAEAALPAEDRRGRGALVPGLLRARRRLRPGQRVHQGETATGDALGHRRPEGLDLARAPGRLVLRGRPHRARLEAAPRPVLPARPDGPGGRRGPADHPAHRHLGVQRGLLQRGPHRRRPRRRRRGQRLEGRDGHARLRARRLHDRPAGRLPARARRAARGGSRQRDLRRPGDPRPPREGAGRARGDPAERAAHPVRGPGAPAGQHLQAALGRLAPHPRRARHAGARRRLADHRARLRPRRVAADVPVHPRGHDLRRVRRDPAQRPGRESPRPSPRAETRESR